MKKLLYLFITSIFLISCSSDDDNNSSLEPIIGEWQLTSYKFNGEEKANDCDKKSTTTFFKNGTGNSIGFDFTQNKCERFTDTFTWVNLGDSKYRTDNGYYAYTTEITFSNNNSVLMTFRTEINNGSSETVSYTYKRI